ncbi:unnamed protein product [Cylicostephanus goldi]|uniref:Uncharacterized protein n=1 Tax=Cylicostephanus goldi TaxID=71465 RepID=A0A3P7R4N1_CYLGO|nr:unnamed protein product [Cylicostephanus goldi]
MDSSTHYTRQLKMVEAMNRLWIRYTVDVKYILHGHKIDNFDDKSTTARSKATCKFQITVHYGNCSAFIG